MLTLSMQKRFNSLAYLLFVMLWFFPSESKNVKYLKRWPWWY